MTAFPFPPSDNVHFSGSITKTRRSASHQYSRSSKRSDYAELPHGEKPAYQPPNSAMRHNPTYGIMTELMECRPVTIDRFEISRRRWHLHEIARHIVVGARAADAEIRAAWRRCAASRAAP